MLPLILVVRTVLSLVIKKGDLRILYLRFFTAHLYMIFALFESVLCIGSTRKLMPDNRVDQLTLLYRLIGSADHGLLTAMFYFLASRGHSEHFLVNVEVIVVNPNIV